MSEPAFTYRTLTKKDIVTVKALVNSFLPSFVQNGYWEWKYLLNPHFDPRMIALAEKDGEIVGCCHWLPERIKISRDIEVKANLMTDLAVKPEYRMRGISSSILLFLLNTRVWESKGAVVNCSFPLNERLGRMWGYLPVKYSTRHYFLLRTWKTMIRRIEDSNSRASSNSPVQRVFARLNLVILLRLRGAPPLTISINEKGIKACENETEHANIIVEGSLGAFFALASHKKTGKQLLRILVTRELRIRGSLRALLKLWRNYHAILGVLHINADKPNLERIE